MKCPTCKTEFTPTREEIASEFGKIKSEAKDAARRENGRLGGWPKGRPRKPKPIHPADMNPEDMSGVL